MFLLTALLAHAADLPTDATGRWLATQSPGEVEKLLADALARTTEPIPRPFRGMAKGMLEENATSCPAYTIALTTTTFEVQCDGRPKHSWTLGEQRPFVTDKGETVQLSVTSAGRSVKLAFSGDKGGKSWTYTFDEQGGLSVRQEVASRFLEVPMVWTLTFRKA